MKNGNQNGIDEHKKLEILEQLASENNEFQEMTEEQAALVKVNIIFYVFLIFYTIKLFLGECNIK